MDTFDKYYVQQEEPSRKASPFADSPYECACGEPEPKKKKTRKRVKTGTGRKILAAVCVLALVVCCCGITAVLVGNAYGDRMEQMQLQTEQRFAELEKLLEEARSKTSQTVIGQPVLEGLTPGQIYSQNADAVVCVTAYGEVTDPTGTYSVGSSGSGFIISENGYVVTNYHVISDMVEFYVLLSDRTELAAEVVGYDADADMALLKVEAEDLPCVQIGSSDALAVGDQVVAIGYPLNSETATLTVGYISAKDQLLNTDGSVSKMLQTDAAINSGNSGGPLFNGAGQVIGITTAKYSGYSSSGASIEGMGFAIPMDEVTGMITDLQEYGYITGAYLGVHVRDVDDYVQMYGLPAGAYVDSTEEGVSADRAGIRGGDVIVKLGGYDIGSVADLTSALRRFKAGDQVVVTLWRNGKEINVTVLLDEKPLGETAQEKETVPETDEVPPTDGFPGWEEFIAPFFGQFPGFGG